MSNTVFQPLELKALPDRIAERLRDAILTGRFPPGSQIVEIRVARELGVGQNAVREALQELEFQGLVTKVRNKGTFVVQLTQEAVEEVFAARIELESLAILWARRAGRPTAVDIEALSGELDRMQTGAESNDFALFSRADYAFHRGLWQLSGNSQLVKAAEVVSAPLFAHVLVRSFRKTELDLRAVVQQHRDWLQTLSEKDPGTCCAYTRDVVGDFGHQILERVQPKAETEDPSIRSAP